MKFKYYVRTQEGDIRTGTIEAANHTAALKILQDNKLIVIKLQSAEKIPFFIKSFSIFGGVKRKEIFVFFRQLSILVEAGVPIVQALKALGRQADNIRFKEIIFEIASDVDGGMSLSKAMNRHPKVFLLFAVNLIQSGEVSGRLQESLAYLADHFEREYYLIAKVRGAMMYPLFILIAFVIVGVLVMTMVIPQLTIILTESGQDLPFSTKIVIASSEFTRNWGIEALIALVALGIILWRYKKTSRGRALWDKFKLKIPIFGRLFQKSYLARVSDNLSVLIKSGVSVVKSLSIAGRVVNNFVFEQIIFEARDEVKVGRSISFVFEQYKEIPPLFSQMLRTGEKTGRLDAILEKVSLFYNKEVENLVDNLSQLIEPILLVILGIGVSILVFSVFMPIYNLAGAF